MARLPAPIEHSPVANEKGFVLIFSMVMLIVITLLGVWALNTSTTEVLVASNEQEFEKSFQISEGGVFSEGGKVGYSKKGWYSVSNPNNLNKILTPSTSTDFDPGQDLSSANPNGVKAADPATWPLENLIGNYSSGNKEMDYSYMVTYLKPDQPPKGTDATKYTGYKFRLNGNQQVDVEAGGIKVGPKFLN